MTNEELVEKVQNGCEESLQKLLKQNSRLIAKIAGEYRDVKEEFDDLKSICQIEMWKAAMVYKGGGAPFYSLAARYMHRKLGQIRTYYNSQGRKGLSVSIDSPIATNNDDVVFLRDILHEDSSLDVYDKADERLDAQKIIDVFYRDATQREREVLELAILEGKNLTEVSEKIGVSKQRVSVIYGCVKKKIYNIATELDISA